MTGAPDALRDAARRGDVGAMTEVGKQLLTSPGNAPLNGYSMLKAAAQLGGGEAAAVVAMLAGAGQFTAQSWPAAIDGLVRAAELGWDPARRQLRLLSSASGSWRELGHALDVAGWTAPAASAMLSEAPRAVIFEGFATPDQCAWMIERAGDRIGPAKVYDPATATAVVQSARSNSAAPFGLLDTDLVLLLLQAKIAAAVGVTLQALESPNVLHYSVGQSFEPHYDFLDEDTPALAREVAVRGQRLATFLVYLNDDYEGGETALLEAGVSHRGKAGDALLFYNLDAAGRPDRATRHAGMPPTRGGKWVLSQWVRQAPALR